MRTHLLLAAAIAGFATAPLHAQSASPADTGAKTPPPIADNSFLVEEAYNQEAGVVQHINAFRRAPDGSWGYGFTQEWPFVSQKHQLSYTVPLLSNGGIRSGIGDLALNYRYQLVGKDEEPVWVSPRLSVVLPTGSVNSGRGAGGPGLQFMLPVSVKLSDVLVTHWDAGVSATHGRSASGSRGDTHAVQLAASAIWLVAPTLNLMLETSWDRTQSLDVDGGVLSDDHFVILPGLRTAINMKSGMQIVPGIGFPIGVGPSRGERDVFLYLSIEHSFK